MNTIPSKNGLIKVLNSAIKKVPVVKYALGIAGIAAAIGIIKSFGIVSFQIPVLGILMMLGLMILLFVFASLTTSKDKLLKLAGYILVYFVVVITVLSSLLLLSAIFFSFPKSFEQIVNVNDINTDSKKTRVLNDITIRNDQDSTFVINGHFIGSIKTDGHHVIFNLDSARIYLNAVLSKKNSHKPIFVKSIRMALATDVTNGWFPISKSDQMILNKPISDIGYLFSKLKFEVDAPSNVKLNQCWLVMMIYTITPTGKDAYIPIQSDRELF